MKHNTKERGLRERESKASGLSSMYAALRPCPMFLRAISSVGSQICASAASASSIFLLGGGLGWPRVCMLLHFKNFSLLLFSALLLLLLVVAVLDSPRYCVGFLSRSGLFVV